MVFVYDNRSVREVWGLHTLAMLLGLAACTGSATDTAVTNPNNSAAGGQAGQGGSSGSSGGTGGVVGIGGSAVAGGTGGTGGVGGAPPARRICDGSDEIRFAWVLPTDPTRELPFTATLYDLGVDFFYVNGKCHYWTDEPLENNDRFQVWRPFREGTMTEEQEKILHDEVGYDDFGSQGPRCSGGLAQDQTPTKFWDGFAVHVCLGAPEIPPGWPALRAALYEGGTPMTAGVRIEVGLLSAALVPSDSPVYPWPLAKEAAAFATDYSESVSFGKSFLISDSAEAAALRSLRDKAIADATVSPGFFYNIIYVEPNGTMVAIRDDLPFTRPGDGLWEPPAP